MIAMNTAGTATLDDVGVHNLSRWFGRWLADHDPAVTWTIDVREYKRLPDEAPLPLAGDVDEWLVDPDDMDPLG